MPLAELTAIIYQQPLASLREALWGIVQSLRILGFSADQDGVIFSVCFVRENPALLMLLEDLRDAQPGRPFIECGLAPYVSLLSSPIEDVRLSALKFIFLLYAKCDVIPADEESHSDGMKPPKMFPLVSKITVRVFGCPSQRR
jgi:hypothetical protein